jgi:hypothetical protein
MKNILLLSLTFAGFASGAQTLQFAATGATGVFTNLQNSSGSTNSTLVWGIVVSTTNSTFEAITNANYYDFAGLVVSDNTVLSSGQALTINGGTATDDRLYISTNLMTVNGTGDGSTGFARPTNLNSLLYNNGVTAGDSFALIWFDYTTKTGQAVATGDKFGMLSLPGFVLPADAGSSSSFASLGAGVDPARPANLAFGAPIPETSTSLLGAIGALALLRRRRN